MLWIFHLHIYSGRPLYIFFVGNSKRTSLDYTINKNDLFIENWCRYTSIIYYLCGKMREKKKDKRE